MSMFLPLTVSKLTQQRLRGSWRQSTKNDILTVTKQSVITFLIWKKVNTKLNFFPTQSSSSCLDKLPIKVGDDCITLLCCVHPVNGDNKTIMTLHQITQRWKWTFHTTKWCKSGLLILLHTNVEHDYPQFHGQPMFYTEVVYEKTKELINGVSACLHFASLHNKSGFDKYITIPVWEKYFG